MIPLLSRPERRRHLHYQLPGELNGPGPNRAERRRHPKLRASAKGATGGNQRIRQFVWKQTQSLQAIVLLLQLQARLRAHATQPTAPASTSPAPL